MIKFSIITINFNNKNGLNDTIKSVFEQSFSNYEFIIIDGNSTDGSKELLEIHKEKFAFAVSEPDLGIFNAMNKGIKVAKGSYLFFLNSGDSFNDELTLSNVNQLIEDKFDICYGNLTYLNVKNSWDHWKFPKNLSLAFFINYSLPHQGSFIKKELFETIGLYNENLKISSDWEFFLKAIIINNASYKHIDIIVSKYDMNGISSNVNNENLVKSEKKLVLNNFFPLIAEDYLIIEELNSKRIKNILYIKKFKFAWKLLKGFSNILLLFLPKKSE
ncbi:glycosyltransferase family 2 protein [Flavobacterium sp.]|uniref:glycosyltransferase family 2 protein n=1 Tax=Flavobacterium sp. TaxID=239 RepID=UPI0037519B81